ncbi:MAG: GDP-mannose 4,6-dehydratase [Planctomycetota bacterium]
MNYRTALVTGSNCFTGAHVVDALLRGTGMRVVGTSRSAESHPMFLPYRDQPGAELDRFAFHQIDLHTQWAEMRALLDDVRPDVIIHVAALSEVALSHEKPLDYFHVNTDATVRLADHARRAGWLQRFVHISSAEIYGACTDAIHETAPLNPTTPYAASKAAADMYLETLRKNFDFPVSLICSTNVYGAYQQLFKIIPRTAIYLRLGKKVQLHGGGQAIKAFIHVRDVVDGILKVLGGEHYGKFHFSLDFDRPIREVVRLVCETAGQDFDTATQDVGERLGQDSRYWLDSGRADRELDWRPHVSFEQGVRETVAWIDRHWDEVARQPLVYQHKHEALADAVPA